MDERALDAIREELLGWGVLEAAPAGLAWTRRFRGAVMREAARLAEDERAGRRAPGAPLAVATAAALLALHPSASDAHAKLAVAIELAALPEGVRAFVG